MGGASHFLSIGVLSGVGLMLLLVAMYAGVSGHFLAAAMTGLVGVSALRVAGHFLMKSRGA